MKLIINADDFGLSKDINLAIIELAELRVLSSTTVMMNMPYAYEIGNMVGNRNFGIGLHFNLTQGKPMSKPESISTLIDDKGEFFSITYFKKRIKEKKISSRHIYIELEAQYLKLKQLVGNRISHIDSHQDINKIGLVTNVLCKYSQSLNKKHALRWYNKTYLFYKNEKTFFIDPSLLSINKFGLKRVLTESYFRIKRKRIKKYFSLPDAMLYTPDNNIRKLLKTLCSLKNDWHSTHCFEIMCHPAKSTEGLIETRMLDARVEEYFILKSEKFQKFVKQVDLVNFGNLSK